MSRVGSPVGDSILATVSPVETTPTGLSVTEAGVGNRAFNCLDFFFGRVLCPDLRAIDPLSH